MALPALQVIEHTVLCQHVREYPNGVKPEGESVLKLAVKQYKSPEPLEQSRTAVTIVSTHANGFPKEIYEPLWRELFAQSKKYGFQIRSVWIADVSHQGGSGVMNEDLLGDDPNWFDHSRDLLSMINQFRDQMPRPIVGIGHSFGGAQLAFLSIMHPQLLTSLILMEPFIRRELPPGPNAAMLSTIRRDIWPSRKEAEAAIRKSKFFASWDTDVLDRYLHYGLRKTPTAIYPAAPEGSVTLTTTKHQESWTYLRSNFEPLTHDRSIERLLSPDLDLDIESKFLFHRAEPGIVQEYLPYIRPSVLYTFGDASPISTVSTQENLVNRTGAGLGGSGGIKAGQVAKVLLQEGGHLFPMEKVKACAELVSAELDKRLGQFKSQEIFLQRQQSAKSERDKLVVSKEWQEGVKKRADTKRSTREKL